MHEIDFHVQEESKNSVGTYRKNSIRKKMSQKWPDFYQFWNCGHSMPKHKMKIDMDNILFMINMNVGIEENLRVYILKTKI